jgi:hypothetical protein
MLLLLLRPYYTRALKELSNINNTIDSIINPTGGNTKKDKYKQ